MIFARRKGRRSPGVFRRFIASTLSGWGFNYGNNYGQN